MGKLVYTSMKIDEKSKDFSVFLAGPTPRSADIPSWRPDMIKELRVAGFQGHIIIPEYKDEYEKAKPKSFVYDRRIAWEVLWLNRANTILFWVPRNMSTMPALTTNIEFGEFMHSKKVILGYPKEAQHVAYMTVRAKWLDMPVVNTMAEAVAHIVKKEQKFIAKTIKKNG